MDLIWNFIRAASPWVALGVMFIVISLICRYGAELHEGKE